MASTVDPVVYARQWAADWNRRDLDAVLSAYHDDVVFSSPIARMIGVSQDGRIVGKAALRQYWEKGLALNPDLHFEVTAVHESIDALVILFRTQDGMQRSEVLEFADGLVIRGFGTLPCPLP